MLLIGNLYQIDIKIIKTNGEEDPNPTINIVSPDEELKEFALLPPGKVPNMTVIHSHSHDNLVVSGPVYLLKLSRLKSFRALKFIGQIGRFEGTKTLQIGEF